MCPPEGRIGEVWRYIVDTFRNKEAEIEVGLEHIQTVFSSFELT